MWVPVTASAGGVFKWQGDVEPARDANSTLTMPAAIRTLLKVIADRLTGGKPGVFRALLAAIIAGIATYKLLRSGS
jgi:hypothetical protein